MDGLTFILGAARSGKSRLAEHLALESGQPVLYVATLELLDDEMRARAVEHRSHRPEKWSLLEEPVDIVEALRREAHDGVVLLDCVTLWVSNLLLRAEGQPYEAQRRTVLAQTDALLAWREETATPLIAVSNEVGGGLVPEYPLGRAFRDLLGEVNQVIAARADRLYHAVAGHYVDLKALGAKPIPRAEP
jgi:adenosylcobinamide kinase/adenosylcobinamide-phosphate guanylyltransferase